MVIVVLLIFISICVLAIHRASLQVWTVLGLTWLLLLSLIVKHHQLRLIVLWAIFLLTAGILNNKKLRMELLTPYLFNRFKSALPKISKTEQEALLAGTVSFEKDLFCGAPDWEKLLSIPPASLSLEEALFLEVQTEALCAMIDDWQITHTSKDLPENVWQFIKAEGFFGLIIPKAYGGKGFSANAHSKILEKISSVSLTVSSTIAVPNSLGPAELLLHYGTEVQKNYYLPRLAKGEEIPCFALTSPTAGSDAAGMTDMGTIGYGEFEGEKILGITLNWDKRYITLAPVATVLGLAFKLYDPEKLFSEKEYLGITCALIPVTTNGVVIGRRHFPMIPFQNGPTQGKDVFIPLDWIIGGAERIGQGWQMLMECLAAGRSISLPSLALGSAKAGLAATSAYARIRKQFKQPIGYFEGVQEVLAKMAGLTYIVDAGLNLTLSLIEGGAKSAIVSSIMKYHATEIGRIVGNCAMDIHGGKGICLGPKNYLAHAYTGIPISITVEGANILTRNMIIFGQGAIRCHPYILQELAALQQGNALSAFDDIIYAHLGFTISNFFATFAHGITGGLFIRTPSGSAKRYFQIFSRFSTAFAFLADFSMMFVGKHLKRKEALSARFADILSYLYLASGILKQYADSNHSMNEFLIVKWSCDYLAYRIQAQFEDLMNNYPIMWLRPLLKVTVLPLGQTFKKPSLEQSFDIAKIMMMPTELRRELITGIYLAKDLSHPISKLQDILEQMHNLELIEQFYQGLVRDGKINSLHYLDGLEEAVLREYLALEEADALGALYRDIMEVIAVDDFAAGEL